MIHPLVGYAVMLALGIGIGVLVGQAIERHFWESWIKTDQFKRFVNRGYRFRSP